MLTSDRNNLIVICAADDRYVMPLSVVIRSLLQNLRSNRNIIFFIIDGGIKKRSKAKLLKSIDSKQCELRWLQPSEGILDKMKVSGHINISAYYRLLIPQLLSKKFSKAIYLDSDLLIQSDLSKLWDINVKDNYLLAVQSASIPYVSSPNGLANYRELGIPSDYKYFNSGVLLINLDKWRTDKIGTKVIKYIEQNKCYIRWHDQDGLNAILAGKWGELEPRWNQTPSIYKFSSYRDSPYEEKDFHNALNAPYIIHFSTPSKPWNSKKGRKHPASNLFFHYVDMTPWSGYRYTLWRSLRNKLWVKLWGHTY